MGKKTSIVKFFFFFTKKIIISLFNPVFLRSLDFNFLFLFFFIIEWSAGPVISAFGVNTESSRLNVTFTTWADSLLVWDLISQLGRWEVEWLSGHVNSSADIFIFGCCDHVDSEWAGRVTRS